jgi:hypothetical protein
MLMTTPQVVGVDTIVNHRTHEGLKMNDGLVYSRTINSGLAATLCVQLRSSNPTVLRKRQKTFAASYLRTTPTRQASSVLPLAFPVSYEALYFKGWPVSAM